MPPMLPSFFPPASSSSIPAQIPAANSAGPQYLSVPICKTCAYKCMIMFQQFIQVKPLCLQLDILFNIKLSTIQPSMFILSYVIKS